MLKNKWILKGESTCRELYGTAAVKVPGWVARTMHAGTIH